MRCIHSDTTRRPCRRPGRSPAGSRRRRSRQPPRRPGRPARAPAALQQRREGSSSDGALIQQGAGRAAIACSPRRGARLQSTVLPRLRPAWQCGWPSHASPAPESSRNTSQAPVLRRCGAPMLAPCLLARKLPPMRPELLHAPGFAPRAASRLAAAAQSASLAASRWRGGVTGSDRCLVSFSSPAVTLGTWDTACELPAAGGTSSPPAAGCRAAGRARVVICTLMPGRTSARNGRVGRQLLRAHPASARRPMGIGRIGRHPASAANADKGSESDLIRARIAAARHLHAHARMRAMRAHVTRGCGRHSKTLSLAHFHASLHNNDSHASLYLNAARNRHTTAQCVCGAPPNAHNLDTTGLMARFTAWFSAPQVQ